MACAWACCTISMPLGCRRGSARPQHPCLHFLVLHLTPSSLLGRGVVRHPRSSTRARRGTFWCKPVWARMQRLAIGGGVIIGTAAYSNSAPQCASRALTEGNEGTP